MSNAYRVLRPKQKLVLLDMIRVYRKASSGDKVYPKGGFQYVWEVCEEDVSESAFYRIRQRLVAVGFFSCPAEIQSMRAGAATRFLPSRDWTNFMAKGIEAKKLAERNRSKKKRLSAKQRRLTDHRTSLGDDEISSRVSKRGRSDMLESGRSDTVENESTCSNEADSSRETDVSHMLESGRRTITIPTGQTEADTDIKTKAAKAGAVASEASPRDDSSDIEHLLAEIEQENRRANLQNFWLDEKPDLGVLVALSTDSSPGSTNREVFLAEE